MIRALPYIGGSYIGLVLLFLYLPVIVMCVMAFNQSELYALPITWSTKWFAALWNNERLIRASTNSLWLALANTSVATTIGTLAAMGLARNDFPGKSILRGLLLPPMAVPWLILGTSMLVMFFWLGLGRGLHTLLLGHVALSLPYVMIVVGARLAGGVRWSRLRSSTHAIVPRRPRSTTWSAKTWTRSTTPSTKERSRSRCRSS